MPIFILEYLNIHGFLCEQIKANLCYMYIYRSYYLIKRGFKNELPGYN